MAEARCWVGRSYTQTCLKTVEDTVHPSVSATWRNTSTPEVHSSTPKILQILRFTRLRSTSSIGSRFRLRLLWALCVLDTCQYCLQNNITDFSGNKRNNLT